MMSDLMKKTRKQLFAKLVKSNKADVNLLVALAIGVVVMLGAFYLISTNTAKAGQITDQFTKCNKPNACMQACPAGWGIGVQLDCKDGYKCCSVPQVNLIHVEMKQSADVSYTQLGGGMQTTVSGNPANNALYFDFWVEKQDRANYCVVYYNLDKEPIEKDIGNIANNDRILYRRMP
jgi:hypothetical protein